MTIPAFGGPEVLTCSTRPDPVVPDGWVVVALEAAALNWHDCLLRQGVHDVALPRIPGADGAGVRRDTGEPVLIMPSLHWGADPRAPGADWEILGDHTDGTYAELVAVPEENVWPVPAGWNFADAAALSLAGLTAYRALFTRGGLTGGETVLVLGAGGGVASIAVSLARVAGADVLVTTSSAEKLALAQAAGARGGALYVGDEWPAEIRALTGGRGVDLVFDSVASTWPEALSCLAPGGRLVNFGATGGTQVGFDVRRFYFAQQTILGTTMGSEADFRGLLALLSVEPSWRPPISERFALDRAGEAHAAMERHDHHGKLILDIAGTGVGAGVT